MSAEEKKKPEHVTTGGHAHIAAAKSAASQRRHQLEANTLVLQWQKFVAALKEGPTHTTLIVGGIVVAAVCFYGVWSYFKSNSEEKNSARWVAAMRLFEGETAPVAPGETGLPPTAEANLEQFAKANEGTTQARLARFFEARTALAKGTPMILSSREAALADVRKAAELYEKLQGESSDDPLLHIEAILNSAKARETLGDFGKALEYYNRFVTEYPNSAFVDEAKAGQKRLAEGSTSRADLESLFKSKGG